MLGQEAEAVGCAQLRFRAPTLEQVDQRGDSISLDGSLCTCRQGGDVKRLTVLCTLKDMTGSNVKAKADMDKTSAELPFDVNAGAAT